MKDLSSEQLIKDVMHRQTQSPDVPGKETTIHRSDLTGKKVDGFPDTEEDKPARQ